MNFDVVITKLLHISFCELLILCAVLISYLIVYLLIWYIMCRNRGV